jgi:4'-phosphopantetheinyl transferase
MSTWLSYAQPNHLGEDEVHLWVVTLAVIPEKSSHFQSILSLDEQERAGRFQKIRDAQRYVAARGSLRTLLGGYLAIESDRLRFAYDAFGKPHLAGELPLTSVNFSISHSNDWGLFGFVRGHKIGVDLERINTDIDIESLARRYFCQSELQALHSLPSEQQRESFYSGWTRKEAYLKGRGVGLSYGLDRVEVSLAPGEPAVILSAFDDPHVSQRWTLQHLSPAPGFIGAVAVETSDIRFLCFQWAPALPG